MKTVACKGLAVYFLVSVDGALKSLYLEIETLFIKPPSGIVPYLIRSNLMKINIIVDLPETVVEG